MIGKKVGPLDLTDPFFENTLPSLWDGLEDRWRSEIGFIPYSEGRVPYFRGRRRERIRRWIQWKRDTGRERLALKIAPWLESP